MGGHQPTSHKKRKPVRSPPATNVIVRSPDSNQVRAVTQTQDSNEDQSIARTVNHCDRHPGSPTVATVPTTSVLAILPSPTVIDLSGGGTERLGKRRKKIDVINNVPAIDSRIVAPFLHEGDNGRASHRALFKRARNCFRTPNPYASISTTKRRSTTNDRANTRSSLSASATPLRAATPSSQESNDDDHPAPYLCLSSFTIRCLLIEDVFLLLPGQAVLLLVSTLIHVMYSMNRSTILNKNSGPTGRAYTSTHTTLFKCRQPF